MASLDVKTAFVVAKPSVVSEILSLTGDQGHVAAAPLAEMQDVQGSACFETCETEFMYSRLTRRWSLMCADNFWLCSDSKERSVCMVNDIIEELLDLDNGAHARVAVVDEYL